MWWKRGFIVLLSLNILVFASGLIAFNRLPSANSKPANQMANAVAPGTTPTQAASVQLSIGQDAINTYLDYALSQQSDVHKVMSYARIQFSDDWTCDIGVKLLNKIVPFHIVFHPVVIDGNLDLQVKSASMGEVPVPTALLFLLLKHLPWPNWIGQNPAHHTIELNFTQRPQKPYGVRILSYSPKSQLLSLQVSILPKDLMTHGASKSASSSAKPRTASVNQS